MVVVLVVAGVLEVGLGTVVVELLGVVAAIRPFAKRSHSSRPRPRLLRRAPTCSVVAFAGVPLSLETARGDLAIPELYRNPNVQALIF